jgi:hypothetical protein
MNSEQVELEPVDRGTYCRNLALAWRISPRQQLGRHLVRVQRKVDEEHSDDGDHEEDVAYAKQPPLARPPPTNRESRRFVSVRPLSGIDEARLHQPSAVIPINRPAENNASFASLPSAPSAAT